MLFTYRHPTHELDGNWESDSGELKMYFPIKPLSQPKLEGRAQAATTILGAYTLIPSVELVQKAPSEAEGTYDIVLARALFKTKTDEELLNEVMRSGAQAAIAIRLGGYCPFPTAEGILRNESEQILSKVSRDLEIVYQSDMIRRAPPKPKTA